MKILVNGAGGFIGSALCPYLLSKGHTIVPVVRRPSCIEGEKIIEGEHSWAMVLKDCDCIVHLAGRVHVARDPEPDPMHAFRIANVDATLALANIAVRVGVRRFVFLSSIKVNGEATLPECPFTLEDIPAPQDPYAISKWEAEQKLIEISERTGLELVIIRSPLVYGAGVKANFAALRDAVLSGWPLPLGAIQNQRSLVALGNLVDFILTCVTHPLAANQTFMVSDGQDISTSELVLGIAQASRRTAHLIPVPIKILRFVARMLCKADDVNRLCGNLQVDISKSQNLLGWVPPLSVKDGLRQLVSR